MSADSNGGTERGCGTGKCAVCEKCYAAYVAWKKGTR